MAEALGLAACCARLSVPCWQIWVRHERTQPARLRLRLSRSSSVYAPLRVLPLQLLVAEAKHKNEAMSKFNTLLERFGALQKISLIVLVIGEFACFFRNSDFSSQAKNVYVMNMYTGPKSLGPFYGQVTHLHSQLGSCPEASIHARTLTPRPSPHDPTFSLLLDAE